MQIRQSLLPSSGSRVRREEMMADAGSPASQDSRNSDDGSIREQDRFMPIANVIRIMRKVLPAHAKISDDAKETIQECVSEFISFITSEANDKCQREQRKTITAEDVLWAMSKLGFDDYLEPLTLFLHKYRETEGDHRGSIRGSEQALLVAKKPSSAASSSEHASINLYAAGLGYYNKDSAAPLSFVQDPFAYK